MYSRWCQKSKKIASVQHVRAPFGSLSLSRDKPNLCIACVCVFVVGWCTAPNLWGQWGWINRAQCGLEKRGMRGVDVGGSTVPLTRAEERKK